MLIVLGAATIAARLVHRDEICNQRILPAFLEDPIAIGGALQLVVLLLLWAMQLDVVALLHGEMHGVGVIVYWQVPALATIERLRTFDFFI